ncbi:helix-turn-helix domain-containing protein [Streptomyces sp. LE64]|uniref:helix-turn-helix domain-containing protein n=1 Tax=Streptomyces sp. LE64 TaxID=3448653 RepID=UPI00404216C2
MGLTATECIQAARIAKLLELTSEPVAQVSWGVGYLDVSNFRRLFQRATGVTPSEVPEPPRHRGRGSTGRGTRRRVSRRGSAPLPPDSS